MRYLFLLFIGLILVYSCNEHSKSDINKRTLFTTMSAKETGIDFSNTLMYDREFNIYRYRNFYNGGGVAIGDINNDSLPDIYFTANMHPNKLYLNKGNFKFEDITATSGTGGTKAWSTGVSMADVNGDGWLDIYVCNSGDIKGDNKENELFINQGNNTFIESALAFGLNDMGYSTHAAFFDYDKDGDLDMYLLNNSYKAIGSFNLRNNIREERDSLGGDKLFRNDHNHFIDVSSQANIYGSLIGFGLGVTVGDIDMDGWPDIYVSNDFFERDYLYINQKDGTFQEVLQDKMQCISAASMGADMADINNDGLPDIFVTDMLPSSENRLKTKTTFEDWNKYQYNVKNGYYHQFIRNMLHLNNGDGTFSEIGRLAGVHATDWSWGALLFDMDLDGHKDIFVANGIYQDLTDQDYLSFISDKTTVQNIVKDDKVDYKQLIDSIPSEAIPNSAFHNEGQLQFKDEAANWGLNKPSFSNGSAYGDLDNDGDLDLVVNNINMPCFVYRNEATTLLKNNYLKVKIKGTGANTHAFGTKIKLYSSAGMQYLEHMPIRGFESSMDPNPVFGLGSIQLVDSLIILFPNQKSIIFRNINTNQTISASQQDAIDYKNDKPPIISKIFNEIKIPAIHFSHIENKYSDFDRDRLIYHMLSTEGPKISVGDMNGDHLQDFYIGNASGAIGAVFHQTKDGSFSASDNTIFKQDKESEDLSSTLFDADGDGDLDLYLCSGGSEATEASSSLIDRLYLNNGSGRYTKSSQILPTPKFESTSCSRAADIDGDGDQDLFVGVRYKPLYYGLPVNGYILKNDGNGNFTDVTASVAPSLLNSGMITDARFMDLDKDTDPDLVICGEYMALQSFINDHGHFTLVNAGLSKYKGWWNTLFGVDIDQDGDMDILAGNHGLNSRFKGNAEHPIRLYINDFDKNGSLEHILTSYREDKEFPFSLKHDLISQMPILKKKYLRYESFAGQSIYDYFPKEQQNQTVIDTADFLETALFMNDGQGQFSLQRLPVEAQFSPVYAILAEDFNQDNQIDFLLGANLYHAKPETGRYDASYGALFLQDSSHRFHFIPSDISGILIKGEIRDIQPIKLKSQKYIIVARNNDSPLFFNYK